MFGRSFAAIRPDITRRGEGVLVGVNEMCGDSSRRPERGTGRDGCRGVVESV